MFGILFLNGDRPDITLENGTLYGGLHCGDRFRYYEDSWLNVRLEYTDNWILVCGDKRLPVRFGAYVDL